MGRVDYRVLGTLQAGSVPQVPRGQRARDVLALLVVRRGHPLPADVILDAVWDADAIRLDASVVHTIVARLRRALGAHAIRRTDAGYLLAAGARVDADEFTGHVTTARTLGPDRRNHSIDLLRRALGLWSGPEAYAGVSDALVATDRPLLHELRDTATEQLAERLLAAGAPAQVGEAVELTSELTSREPLRERARTLQMEGLCRLGRRGDALAAYDLLRHALRDELGIDPGPTATEMHARILADDGRCPTSAPRGPRRGAPPRPRTPTIGRDRELAALSEQLAAGRRLVTIVGPGGVGKSHLLAEFATGVPARTALAYAELPCVPDAAPAAVAETIAHAAGITLGAGGDPVDRLAAALRPSEALWLLDEAEWALAASTAVIGRLLSACPRIRFVVTSRVRLDLRGESLLLLGPLPAPPTGASAAGLRAFPAMRLFVDRLGDHVPDLVLDDAELARAAEIVRQVDGLPLALEIVAGQAVASSVADLLGIAEAPLDIVAVERDRRPRQRSLRDTLTWSVQRLPGPVQTVQNRLGVFAGPFDMAAAEAVVGHVPGDRGGAVDVPAAVRLLIREAQVHVDRRDGAVRMRMLRTVQCLARERLAATGGLAAATRRHRTWYAARWREQPLSDALVSDVAAAYPDYLAALRGALAERDPNTLGDLAIVLSRYWFFVETGGEGVHLVRSALASGVLGARQTAILQLLEAALLPQDRGLEQRAVLEDLAPALAEDPDWLGRLHILRSVGPYVRGDFARALACAGEAVAVAGERAPHHLPEALGAYAVMLAAIGDTGAALAAGRQAWELIAEAPTAVDLTQVVPKVALALIDSDHPREALTILDRSLARVEDDLGLAPLSLFTTNAGWAALGCNEPQVALERFTRSLDHLAGGGDLLVIGEVLSGAGAALAALGRAEAPAILDLAASRLRSAGAVLSPWQQATVGRHRDLVAGTSGTTLPLLDVAQGAALIRGASGSDAGGATGPRRVPRAGSGR